MSRSATNGPFCVLKTWSTPWTWMYLVVRCSLMFVSSGLDFFERERGRELDQGVLEHQADDADHEDRDDDVHDVEVVPLVPHPEADADAAGEHFRGDDHEPGGADCEPHAG